MQLPATVIIEQLVRILLLCHEVNTMLFQLNLSAEWLCFVDGISQYTLHKQDYSMMKYVPFLPVVFHLVYAAFIPPRISFPHVQFEVSGDLTFIFQNMLYINFFQNDHLVGLVVKVSVWRAEDPGFESCLQQDF